MLEIDKTVREEIDECLKDIMEIAQIHKLPFFFTMAVGDTGDKTEYRKELYSPQILGVDLTDDTIRKHELIEAGFDPVPPRENFTMDMGELLNG